MERYQSVLTIEVAMNPAIVLRRNAPEPVISINEQAIEYRLRSLVNAQTRSYQFRSSCFREDDCAQTDNGDNTECQSWCSYRIYDDWRMRVADRP